MDKLEKLHFLTDFISVLEKHNVKLVIEDDENYDLKLYIKAVNGDRIDIIQILSVLE